MNTELVHSSLFTIEGAIVSLFELRAEAEAEGDAEQLAVLDKEIDAWVKQEIRKVDSIAGYIRECELRAETEKAEAARHADRSAMWQARADRVRQSSLEAMAAYGVKAVETPQNTMRVQGNGGVEPLEVTDMTTLPDTYKRITVTMPLEAWKSLVEDTWAAGEVTSKGRIEADRTLIQQCLKHGVKIDGAKLLDRGFHLRLS